MRRFLSFYSLLWLALGAVCGVVALNVSRTLVDLDSWFDGSPSVEVPASTESLATESSGCSDSSYLTWLMPADTQELADELEGPLSIESARVRIARMEMAATCLVLVDPEHAIRQATALPLELSRIFRGFAGVQWARLDLDSFLSFVERDSYPEDFREALEVAMSVDPGRAFPILHKIDGQADGSSGLSTPQEGELAAMLEYNAGDALRIVLSLPSGQDRNALIRQLFETALERDRELALAMASTLNENEASVAYRAIIGKLAGSSFVDAFRLAQAYPFERRRLIDQALASAIADDQATALGAANYLVVLDDSNARNILSGIVGSMLQNDLPEALAWMDSNSALIDPELWRVAAVNLSPGDALTAIDYVSRVPDDMRNMWVSAAAAEYADADVFAAMNWVNSLSSESAYESAFVQVFRRLYDSEPGRAAEWLAQSRIDYSGEMFRDLAYVWAEQEPEVAAAWALNLRDPIGQGAALQEVARSWSMGNANNATQWAMSVPDRALRDDALYGLLVGSSESGVDPFSILDLFSSEAMRQQALTSAIYRFVVSDTDTAEELIAELADESRRAVLISAIQASR